MPFEDIEKNIEKKNKILFTRSSHCLQDIRKCIANQKQTTLILWAFDCMQIPLQQLQDTYKDNPAFQDTYDKSKLWAQGKIKMLEAKRAILACHAQAKQMDDTHDIALCHAIGQGCGSVHVETHAIGLLFYELTAIVVKHHYKGYEQAIIDKIAYYKERLLWWQIHESENTYEWASFLIREGKVNKEKVLLEKETK